MQINEKKILNVNIMLNLKKKEKKRHRFKNTPSHASLLGNGLNIFQFEIIQVITYTIKNCLT
jgi:hypothetical protein